MSHGRRWRVRWRIEMGSTKTAIVNTDRCRSLHRRWDHYSNGRNGLDWLGWWRRTCPNRFGWLLLLLLLLLPHDQCRGRCFVVTIEFEVSRRSDFIFVVCFFFSFKYIYDVIVLVFDYWLLTWISLILYFF